MSGGFILAILATGFAGIVAEIVLLRELLISFHGNELTIGVILANWLIAEAAGAYFLGKRIERDKRRLEAFVVVTIVFSLAFALALYLARTVNALIGLTPGEGMGIIPVFISSLCILLPVGVTHGGLFSVSCGIVGESSPLGNAAGIGRVYLYETIGTIIGGVGLTYLLIPRLNSMTIAIGVACLNCLVSWVLLFRSPRRGLTAAALIGTILTAGLIVSGGADRLHRFSVDEQWKPHTVRHYENSVYGNVTVIEQEGQYTFFADGLPRITSPVPDIVFLEEFVHLPLLFAGEPETILVLGGGAGGMLNEIMKHPSVRRIDYAELDPLIIELAEEYTTPLTENELRDGRVHLEYIDGRMALRKAPRRYDVIFVGLSDPSDLQTNRFFTEEFFGLATEKLIEDGIFVISLPGSPSYLNEELRDLNACVINALRAVFPSVRSIPGEHNMFLASESDDIIRIGANVLGERLLARKPSLGIITPRHIQYKLSGHRADWFREALGEGTRRINRDFVPTALFYSIAYHAARFSPSLIPLFRAVGGLKLGPVCWFFLVGAIGAIAIGKRCRPNARHGVAFAIGATGFAGMIFDLVFICTFQIFYGYAFSWIGLLVTALMAGMAAGSFAMTRYGERMPHPRATFMILEGTLVAFSLALPLVFMVLHRLIHFPSTGSIKAVFLGLSFLSGLLIGAEFPLAGKIELSYRKPSPTAGTAETAGILYGADLLGGWLSGIVGGVLLVPVLGILKTCAVVAMGKVLSMTIYALSERKEAIP